MNFDFVLKFYVLTHCALEKNYIMIKKYLGVQLIQEEYIYVLLFSLNILFCKILHENAKEETKMTKEERDDKDDSSLLFFR